MEWLTPAFALGLGGLLLTLLSQLSKAVQTFESHIKQQAILGVTVKRLDGTVGELKDDVNELQNVLRNGLNARLAEVKHAVEMQQQYCQMRITTVNDKFDTVNGRLDGIEDKVY